MKKGLLNLTTAIVLLTTLGFSNPDGKEHRQEVRAYLNKLTDENRGLFAEFSPDGGTDAVTEQQMNITISAVKDVTSAFAEKSLEAAVNVTNYLVCSIGEVDLDRLGVKTESSEDGITTFGIMGHVFTLDNQWSWFF